MDCDIDFSAIGDWGFIVVDVAVVLGVEFCWVLGREFVDSLKKGRISLGIVVFIVGFNVVVGVDELLQFSDFFFNWIGLVVAWFEFTVFNNWVGL